MYKLYSIVALLLAAILMACGSQLPSPTLPPVPAPIQTQVEEEFETIDASTAVAILGQQQHAEAPKRICMTKDRQVIQIKGELKCFDFQAFECDGSPNGVPPVACEVVVTATSAPSPAPVPPPAVSKAILLPPPPAGCQVLGGVPAGTEWIFAVPENSLFVGAVSAGESGEGQVSFMTYQPGEKEVRGSGFWLAAYACQDQKSAVMAETVLKEVLQPK